MRKDVPAPAIKGPAEQQLRRAETVGARRVSELQEAGAECIHVDVNSVAIRRWFWTEAS